MIYIRFLLLTANGDGLRTMVIAMKDKVPCVVRYIVFHWYHHDKHCLCVSPVTEQDKPCVSQTELGERRQCIH